MSDAYFSDRERGPRARTHENVAQAAWGGVVALLRTLASNGSLAVDFPQQCPDGRGPTGTDEQAFSLALRGEVPGIPWPLDAEDLPPTLAILDLIEFCHRHVAEPVQDGYHGFFGHYHLSFDRQTGRTEFRERVNRLFGRNGIAFDLADSGQIVRLAPPILRDALGSASFHSGDAGLDVLLETARVRFLSPNPETRREALEKLWDAWERVKTLQVPGNKKASITALLNGTAQEPKFRAVLEKEARELTDIGNTFSIRHSETTQTCIERSEHVDYLFHRLFALVQLLLRSRT